MTYKFNKETHSIKVKAGMQAAKQAGKKLGRPKSGKIKGEDEVIFWWKCGIVNIHMWEVKATYANIARTVGVSIGTVQRIINKYKNGKET